ncbi:MAG: STAS domain-containing protein [Candidatus Eremiobacteraeota bacterium]|nr:STAS domain-containing protein [Candidatus Eremiobacteraeota bacterium]
MEIALREEKNIHIVTVSGKLDAVSVRDFDEKIQGLLESGALKMLFRLESLEYISSIGLRSFLQAAKTMKKQKGRIAFSGLQETTAKIFKIAGFYEILGIYSTEEEALAALV